MGGIQSQTEPQVKYPEKTFFYYPAYGHTYNHKFADGQEKQRTYARRVLAGVVSNGKIFVSEALCFTGDGSGKQPDEFNKALGRTIAEGRAYKCAGFKLKNGKPQPLAFGTRPKAVMVIPIPEGCTTIGKLFVTEVEKVYPKQVKVATPATDTMGVGAPSVGTTEATH